MVITDVFKLSKELNRSKVALMSKFADEYSSELTLYKVAVNELLETYMSKEMERWIIISPTYFLDDKFLQHNALENPQYLNYTYSNRFEFLHQTESLIHIWLLNCPASNFFIQFLFSSTSFLHSKIMYFLFDPHHKLSGSFLILSLTFIS